MPEAFAEEEQSVAGLAEFHRPHQLTERRAELTLRIAVLGERKVAKLIELMEEQRRDNPLLALRVDEEAEHMAHSMEETGDRDG